MRIIKRNNTGFTLIETLVAVAVMLAVVLGPVDLVTRGIFSLPESKNEIIATNLAQEGIELVREIRDNNVFCGTLVPNFKWWEKKQVGDFEIDPFTKITITCTGKKGTYNIQTPVLQSDSSRFLLLEPNGKYNYASGVQTSFKRTVSICLLSGSCNAKSADVSIPPKDQMDVISTVTWQDHGINHSVSLQERFYNWQ